MQLMMARTLAAMLQIRDAWHMVCLMALVATPVALLVWGGISIWLYRRRGRDSFREDLGVFRHRAQRLMLTR